MLEIENSVAGWEPFSPTACNSADLRYETLPLKRGAAMNPKSNRLAVLFGILMLIASFAIYRMTFVPFPAPLTFDDLSTAFLFVGWVGLAAGGLFAFGFAWARSNRSRLTAG